MNGMVRQSRSLKRLLQDYALPEVRELYERCRQSAQAELTADIVEVGQGLAEAATVLETIIRELEGRPQEEDRERGHTVQGNGRGGAGSGPGPRSGGGGRPRKRPAAAVRG